MWHAEGKDTNAHIVLVRKPLLLEWYRRWWQYTIETGLKKKRMARIWKNSSVSGQRQLPCCGENKKKWIFEFHKLQAMSRLAQDLLVSQKLLLSITLVCRQWNHRYICEINITIYLSLSLPNFIIHCGLPLQFWINFSSPACTQATPSSHWLITLIKFSKN